MAEPSFEPGQPSTPHALYTETPASIAGLPKGVAEKVLAIVDFADAAHRQMPLHEERHEANTARGDAQRRLDRLLAHPQDSGGGGGAGFGLHEDDTRVVHQRRLVEEATAAAKRMDDRYQRATELWQPRARTRGDCRAWLKDGRPRGTTITDYAGREPTLHKGEDFRAAFLAWKDALVSCVPICIGSRARRCH
jgi:hypothetical protein